MRNSQIIKTSAAAVLIASTIFATPALATPGQGFAPSPVVNASYGGKNVNKDGD